MSTAAQDYWLRAIRSGFVVGLLGGPPCETWSRARGRELEGRRGPRVLRTPEFPWGLCSLGLRELKQLIFGSTLLLYILEDHLASKKGLEGRMVCMAFKFANGPKKT